MKIGAAYEVQIIGMTQDGCGIGFVDGVKVFVRGAVLGEKVQVQITKICEEYAAARITSVVTACAQRVEPFCNHFGECGGCAFQNIAYRDQLKIKTEMVREALVRIAEVDNQKVENAIGMELPLRYRNKALYPVGETASTTAIGFYRTRSNQVVDIAECGVQQEISNKVKNVVKNHIKSQGLSIYHKERGQGLVRHLVIRTSRKTGEVMAVLVINGDTLPAAEQFVAALVQAVPQVKSIYININKDAGNNVMGVENLLIYGQPTITDAIGRFLFEISPLSFFQVNPIQTEVLYDKVVEYAGLTGHETVLDLYCGIGTISLYLAEKARRVIGVEAVEEAIEDAVRNAKRNGIENVEFVGGRVEQRMEQVLVQAGKVDVVVIDPPRKGCKVSVLDAISRLKPDRIVYVSCNPTTLARDVKLLMEKGFSLEAVQPIDMFPHTSHVECVVLMSRVDK